MSSCRLEKLDYYPFTFKVFWELKILVCDPIISSKPVQKWVWWESSSICKFFTKHFKSKWYQILYISNQVRWKIKSHCELPALSIDIYFLHVTDYVKKAGSFFVYFCMDFCPLKYLKGKTRKNKRKVREKVRQHTLWEPEFQHYCFIKQNKCLLLPGLRVWFWFPNI